MKLSSEAIQAHEKRIAFDIQHELIIWVLLLLRFSSYMLDKILIHFQEQTTLHPALWFLSQIIFLLRHHGNAIRSMFMRSCKTQRNPGRLDASMFLAAIA